MLGIGVEKPPNHPLILRVVLLRLGLEKVDTTFAQCDGDLDPFILKYKILRSGEKISDDLGVSEGFVRVLDFRAHKFVCPFASSLRQTTSTRCQALTFARALLPIGSEQ